MLYVIPSRANILKLKTHLHLEIEYIFILKVLSDVFIYLFVYVKSLKAVVTPQCLLVLDFRGLGLEKWLVLELGPQLAGDGNLATYSLPFEFRALEAILQHRVSIAQL